MARARRFKVRASGRNTVRPFTQKEANDIRLLCKKKMASAASDEQTYLWHRNYILINLGLNTALRIEDLVQLKVENVKTGYIDIYEFKTNKKQQFELNKNLLKDLLDYIEMYDLHDEEYLIKSRKGFNMPLTRQQSYNIIKKLALELNIHKPVGCHSLRKTFGRLYYEQTKDLVGLMEMLNHTDTSVTLVYICWGDEDVNKARKNFYI